MMQSDEKVQVMRYSFRMSKSAFCMCMLISRYVINLFFFPMANANNSDNTQTLAANICLVDIDSHEAIMCPKCFICIF